MVLRKFVLSALVLAAALSAARAEEERPKADEVITKISAEELARALKEEGFESARVVKDKEAAYVAAKVDGYTVVFHLPGEGKYVYAGFRLSGTKATLREINAWNDREPFTRAVLCDDGDVCLHVNLELLGGVTRRTVRNHLVFFMHKVRPFVRHVSVERAPGGA